jgi:pyruvate formate lyase activating enzyme
MAEAPPTPRSTLARARHIAFASGIRYAYTEDPVGSSTYCFRCGRLLIERDGHALASWGLGTDGHCPSCSEPCPGVFEASPGAFRGQHTEVRLGEPELVGA